MEGGLTGDIMFNLGVIPYGAGFTLALQGTTCTCHNDGMILCVMNSVTDSTSSDDYSDSQIPVFNQRGPMPGPPGQGRHGGFGPGRGRGPGGRNGPRTRPNYNAYGDYYPSYGSSRVPGVSHDSAGQSMSGSNNTFGHNGVGRGGGSRGYYDSYDYDYSDYYNAYQPFHNNYPMYKNQVYYENYSFILKDVIAISNKNESPFRPITSLSIQRKTLYS